MNSRLFWPRTVPVKVQYCRSRKQPEWTITGHEELALPLREADAAQGVDAGHGHAVVDVGGAGMRASQKLLHAARMRP